MHVLGTRDDLPDISGNLRELLLADIPADPDGRPTGNPSMQEHEAMILGGVTDPDGCEHLVACGSLAEMQALWDFARREEEAQVLKWYAGSGMHLIEVDVRTIRVPISDLRNRKHRSVVISKGAVGEWGCPYCNYAYGRELLASTGMTKVYRCDNKECDRTYAVVPNEMVRSDACLRFNDPDHRYAHPRGKGCYCPSVIRHPHMDVPVWEVPDERHPSGGEYFDIVESSPSPTVGPCSFCGSASFFAEVVEPRLITTTVTVRTKAAGERILAMFERHGLSAELVCEAPQSPRLLVRTCMRDLVSTVKLYALVAPCGYIEDEDLDCIAPIKRPKRRHPRAN
jgi:hypothetical protein